MFAAEGRCSIGIIWVNHHAMFDHLERANGTVLFLNLLLLLIAVVFILYPTAVLGDYIRAGGEEARAAAVLYSVTMAAWAHRSPPSGDTPSENGASPADLHPTTARAMHPANVIGTVVYTATVAFVIPAATLAIYAALALYFGLGARATSSTRS